MAGPLSGLKVVEMAGLGPCPLAGQLLADLGADVVVIDRKSAKADPSDINRRSKRSIALNLKSEGGLLVAKKLIANADILIEGFRPGVMEKLGLGPKDCHQKNPGLVFGRMTGWGQDGPLAKSAGHDINYLAITGALHAIGRKGEPPVPPLNLVADYAGGTMFLLLGVLSALYERQTSGLGQVVDAAMVDGVPALMGLTHMMFAKGQWSNNREDNLLDGGAPFYRTYETSDGKYVSVGPLEPQFFAELVEKAGLPETRKQTQYDRATWPDCHKELETVFKSKSRDEWTALFEGGDACIAPILNFDEVENFPHNKARGIFQTHDGVMQAAPAPRFDRTPSASIGQPLCAGASNEEVLREYGFSAQEIAVLISDGAVV
ncbi:MAG: CaiB/BaiF CoA-transferase family protein [Salaquimonas sp.]